MEEEFDELKKYVCRNGTLIQSTCFLVNPVRTSVEKSYLKIVLDQSARDLKGSLFLAFSGHYRQAMQVLRCSFENLISGVYFHSDLCGLTESGAAKEEFVQLDKRFNEWKEGGRVNIRADLEVLRRIGFLDSTEEKNWRNYIVIFLGLFTRRKSMSVVLNMRTWLILKWCVRHQRISIKMRYELGQTRFKKFLSQF